MSPLGSCTRPANPVPKSILGNRPMTGKVRSPLSSGSGRKNIAFSHQDELGFRCKYLPVRRPKKCTVLVGGRYSEDCDLPRFFALNGGSNDDANALAFFESREAGALKCRNVEKQILFLIIKANESVTKVRIEPFYRTNTIVTIYAEMFGSRLISDTA